MAEAPFLPCSSDGYIRHQGLTLSDDDTTSTADIIVVYLNGYASALSYYNAVDVGSTTFEGRKLTSKTLEQEGKDVWIANYSFTLDKNIEIPGGGGGGSPDYRPQVVCSYWTEEMTAMKDTRTLGGTPFNAGAFPTPGNPVTNTALDILSPIPQYTQPWPQYDVTLISETSLFADMNYVGKVNSNTFTIANMPFIKYTVMLAAFNETKVGENKYECTYTFKIRNGTNPYNLAVITGWTSWFLNAGFNEIRAGKKVPIVMADNEVATNPQILDATGAAVSDGTAHAPLMWLDYMCHPLADLSVELLGADTIAKATL